jgi:ectoine hydroxylase-related dioxygenase (phytanoyl-CoA dioxygenase family)
VEHGIALVHLDELFPGKDVTSELIEEVQRQKNEAKIGEKKPFLQYILGENSVLDLKNPFIQLSLRHEILDIVNSYLGMCSKLIYFDLAVTKLMHTRELPLGSQRWHRDRGIKRMVKVFIYLVDVDEENGPFTYVLQSHAGGRWRTLFPQKQFGRHGFYPPQGSVDQIVPKDDVKCCTGRAGTVIFCDTTGLHKGGFSISKQRVMFTSAYVAKGDVQRPEFRYPTNFKEHAKQLDAISRFAIT